MNSNQFEGSSKFKLPPLMHDLNVKPLTDLPTRNDLTAVMHGDNSKNR